jgi:hypothetical protein
MRVKRGMMYLGDKPRIIIICPEPEVFRPKPGFFVPKKKKDNFKFFVCFASL